MRIGDWSSDVCSSDLRFNERIIQNGTISLPVLFLQHSLSRPWELIALFQGQKKAAITKIQPSAACFSSAMRSSSARLGLVDALFNWPQAAMMSRPRGVRIGAELPASKIRLLNARTRSGDEDTEGGPGQGVDGKTG